MLITSKFNGSCTACNTAIAAGERVWWVRGHRGVKHARCSDEGKQAAENVETQLAASRAADAEVDAPAPEGLSYLPYQRAGIAYAAARRGVLIADEMGLGKTIQAIGAINADESIRSVLVICPASLKLNWRREMSKWLVREHSIAIVNGKCPPIGALGKPLEITIANYDVLKKHLGALDREWDLVVVDEAHYCKNNRTQRSKLTAQLVARARRRIALTGTPIANRPVELWPLLQMIDPGHWDPALPAKGKWPERSEGSGAGFMRFAKRYCGAHQIPIARGRTAWDFSGSSNLAELQEKLRMTCMIRRLKADVLTDLPAKRRQVIELPGGADIVGLEHEAWERQAERIESARVEVELARASDDEDDYKAAVARLSGTMRLAFTEISAARHRTALAKCDLVIEHVREALESSGKIVLFAHHKDLIAKLAAELSDVGAVVLTGDTAMEDRQAAVDRFQTDATCRVFIGSITAAGVGLTLTAASHVIFAELDWVPGNVSQAEDRCHRIGQRDSVLVQHLVLDGSLDAKMARTIVRKQEIADAGLDRQVAFEPAIPAAEPAATEGRRAEIAEAASKLTADQIEAIHEALRVLAARCDGAATEDGAGFARIDVRIGHELAHRPSLTPKQAALGQRLVRKYRRQLGAMVESCGLAA